MDDWRSWLELSGVGLLVFLFLLLLVEEAGVPLPLPGYLVVAYLGLRTQQGQVDALSVLVVVSVAVTAGSCTLYGLALWLKHSFLERLGRWVGVNASRVDRLERWFRAHGPLVVVVGRLIPNLRNATSAAAGLLELPWPVFVPATALAAVVWTLLYFAIGFFLAPATGWFAGLGVAR